MNSPFSINANRFMDIENGMDSIFLYGRYLGRSIKTPRAENSNLRAKMENEPFIILKENSTFPYMGKHITLKVITDKSAKTRKITLEETDLTIRTSSDIYSERLKRWIINDFKEKVKSISEEKSLNIKKEIKSVRVSDTKTRWGSCSHDGRLCFSWRLAFAPYEAIDYVVAHEVAHLRHLNHSKEFWTLCEELSIDYAAGKRWMKENGSELMRYVFAQ